MRQWLTQPRQFLSSDQSYSSIVRDLFIFALFLLLTVVMTWPWALHLRDAASDPGDPYLVSWILWWDYHQTFHSPLNLFHANILYPYKYSLAFSEHHYGISLLFFPLFALGVRPLTVHGIATLFGFAFCGYGAFRLARTLTGCNGAAWIAGIAFAFVPYRFGQLPHLVYLWSGWIPILLEALVLFVGKTSWKRAAWLGVAFFFNAISAIHWFSLTLIPLALTILFLLTKHRRWSDRLLWKRGVTSISVAGLALLPFFIPYVQAARLYGFVRSEADARFYSATLMDWLVGEARNKMWHRLNVSRSFAERQLFPGLTQPLLALAAILLIAPRDSSVNKRITSVLLIVLDVALIVSAILMITISGYGYFKFQILGRQFFQIESVSTVATVFVIALIVRLILRYPHVLKRSAGRNLIGALRSNSRSDGFWIGIILTVIGFIGSLGMNFFFHRTLYQFVPLFRSIRVPSRWAMICYLGLALLAGIGAMQIASLLRRHWPRIKPAPVFAVLAMVLLVEQRAAPLDLIRGEVDPDGVTQRLKQTQISGGIVALPFKEGTFPIYLYSLRAADHGKPLVTAVSGFMPPIQLQIQAMIQKEPVPDAFFDLLESIPTSYVVFYKALLEPGSGFKLEEMLRRGVANGRLRYINSYEAKADLFAVVKNEPKAETEAALPEYLLPTDEAIIEIVDTGPSALDDPEFFTRVQYRDVLARDPDPGGLRFWAEQIERCGDSNSCKRDARTNVSAALFGGDEFNATAFFIYRLYTRTLGRTPSYDEFTRDRSALVARGELEESKASFLSDWLKRQEVSQRYPAGTSNDAFVDALSKTSSDGIGVRRADLLNELNAGAPREQVFRRVAEDAFFSAKEHHQAVVLLRYFVYLKREPEPISLALWVRKFETRGQDADRLMVHTFLNSAEYRARFAGKQ